MSSLAPTRCGITTRARALIIMFGSHPFYMVLRTDGTSHGVFLLNSNAMNIVVTGDSLNFHVVGGILDLYVFDGRCGRRVHTVHARRIDGLPSAHSDATRRATRACCICGSARRRYRVHIPAKRWCVVVRLAHAGDTTTHHQDGDGWPLHHDIADWQRETSLWRNCARSS